MKTDFIWRKSVLQKAVWLGASLLAAGAPFAGAQEKKAERKFDAPFCFLRLLRQLRNGGSV